MASIFKPTYTKKDPDTGETEKDPQTGEKVLRRLSKYYIKYRDADGIIRKVPGFTDKAATFQLAARLEREAELGKLGIVDPFEKHRKRPLKEHVEEFEKHLQDKGNTPEHVRQVAGMVRKTATWCKFVFVSDISASPVAAFLADLRGRGRSIETSNHYLSAMKEFCRWLVMDRRSADNPVAHMQKQNVKTDRRHDRRALTPEEFRQLVESAMQGPPIEGVDGVRRQLLLPFSDN